jgi:hypothetical protein
MDPLNVMHKNEEIIVFAMSTLIPNGAHFSPILRCGSPRKGSVRHVILHRFPIANAVLIGATCPRPRMHGCFTILLAYLYNTIQSQRL